MVWYERSNARGSSCRNSFRRDEFVFAATAPSNNVTISDALQHGFAHGLERSTAPSTSEVRHVRQAAAVVSNGPSQLKRMSVLLTMLHLDDHVVVDTNSSIVPQGGRPQKRRQQQTSRASSVASRLDFFGDDSSSVGSVATLNTYCSAVSCLFRQTKQEDHNDTESSSSSFSDDTEPFRREQIDI